MAYHNLILVSVPFLVMYFIKAWFESTLACQLTNVFLPKSKKLYTFSDFETWLINKPYFIHSLLTCPICLAWHISWSIVTGIALVTFLTTGIILDFILCAIAFAVSSWLAASFGTLGNPVVVNRVVQQDKPKTRKPRKEKAKDTDTPPPAQTDTEEPKQSILEIKDIGGHLVEIDSAGKSKLIGKTKLLEEHVENVFSETTECNFPGCAEHRAEYFKQLKIMEDSYASKGVKCPECNKAGLKRRFYDKIKAEFESKQNVSN